MRRILLLVYTACVLLAGLTGCGSDDSSTPTSTPSTTITGSVYAAPVDGASVVVQDDNGNVVAGPVTTAADGAYTVEIPTSALAGNLRIEATGGTFTDEATDTPTTAGRLSAYLEGGTLGVGAAVHLDPSSTIVHDLVTSGSGLSFATAKSRFSTAFGYTPDSTVAPRNTATTGATDSPNRLAGLRAAAFSQLAKDMGLTPAKQFDLLAAIADDLADDGNLNGSAAAVNGTSLTEDMVNRFETALTTFMADSVRNHTGLTSDQIGTLPCGRVVLTTTYRVEYIPGTMTAKQGKTQFMIKVTRRDNSTVVTGLVAANNIKLMPLMHMPTRNHATPVDTITDNGDGTYSCTAYYLMASGPGMGFWDMKVMIGSGMEAESATFHPAVGMAMGTTTVRATLKGVSDLVLGTPPANRSYYLFNNGLTNSMSTYAFNLFVATKESMMSWPAVGTGTTLKNELETEWVVNPITVEASTDKATWLPATEGSVAGHWSIANLTGLTSGQPGTIYVRMSVNGELKTTDGAASTGTNDYATFTVTPGM